MLLTSTLDCQARELGASFPSPAHPGAQQRTWSVGSQLQQLPLQTAPKSSRLRPGGPRKVFTLKTAPSPGGTGRWCLRRESSLCLVPERSSITRSLLLFYFQLLFPLCCPTRHPLHLDISPLYVPVKQATQSFLLGLESVANWDQYFPVP